MIIQSLVNYCPLCQSKQSFNRRITVMKVWQVSETEQLGGGKR